MRNLYFDTVCLLLNFSVFFPLPEPNPPPRLNRRGGGGSGGLVVQVTSAYTSASLKTMHQDHDIFLYTNRYLLSTM